MRRFFVIVATVVAVLAGAISASAATSHPAPQAGKAGPAARPTVELAAELAAAKRGAVQAALAQIVAEHTAHLAHSQRVMHAQHLHLLHLRQLAVLAARTQARSAAVRKAGAVPAKLGSAPASSTETTGSSGHSAAYTGGSGFQACVISRESGGNSQVMNGSGHYGLYQFSEGTWEAYGGSAGSFGHASVAQQNQVFDNAMATAGGASNWSAYDGCTDAVITGAPAANATLTALIRPAETAAAHAAHLAHLAHLAQERVHATLTAMVGSSRGAAALAWAVANGSGHAYVWGGTGPGFDCSGLVMEAYAHAAGVSLPHSTYGMLDSSHLVRVTSPAAGDLAFFGTGHVELYVRAGETFGAHDAAEGIGYMPYGGSWAPSAFYRVT